VKTKMTIDPYTKFILTIIALCLVWICLNEVKLFPMLHAASPDIIDVRIKAIEKASEISWDPIVIETYGNLPTEVKNIVAIPVEVKNVLLPVDVKNVEVKSVLVPLEKKKQD
jgi:hypothetical protein